MNNQAISALLGVVLAIPLLGVPTYFILASGSERVPKPTPAKYLAPRVMAKPHPTVKPAPPKSAPLEAIAGATIAPYSSWQAMGVVVDSNDAMWVTKSDHQHNSVVTKFARGGKPLATFEVGDGGDSMAIDRENNVWISNGNEDTVSKLASDGRPLGKFTVGRSPLAIATDYEDNAWVVNCDDGTVSKLSPAGETLGTFQVAEFPTALAVSTDGSVWVACGNASSQVRHVRVCKLSHEGALEGTYDVEGELDCGGIAFDHEGNVWIAGGSSLVTELASDGSLVGHFKTADSSTKPGVPGGFVCPTGVPIDHADHVWVSDYVWDQVHELDHHGHTVARYRVGSTPNGLVLDSQDHPWVAVSKSAGLQRLH